MVQMYSGAVRVSTRPLDRIKGYAVTYPVVIDMENPPDKEARTQALVGKKTLCTDIAIAFKSQ